MRRLHAVSVYRDIPLPLPTHKVAEDSPVFSILWATDFLPADAADVFRADAAIRQQLCYVAVSRARTGVWLIGGTASAATERAWRHVFASTLSAS